MKNRSITVTPERSSLAFKSSTPFFTSQSSPENKTSSKRTTVLGQSGLIGGDDKTVQSSFTPEEESEQNEVNHSIDAEIITREAIKASCKTKLLQQKKRMMAIVEQDTHENSH
jgi:hypothetical protein